MNNPPFMPKRIAGICAVLTCIFFLFIYKLVLGTGLVPGADEAVDQRTKRLEDIAARRQTVEGIFLDCKGEAITNSEEPGKPAKLLYSKAYSYIIGYNSSIYGTSGLRSRLYDHLFYGRKDGNGAEVTLTTDNALQQFCYDRLGDHEGSIIVLNAETGEILSMASRSNSEVAYDVNEIDEQFSTYRTIDAFLLNPATMAEQPGGSTFKTVMTAALVKHGMEDFTWDDPTGYIEIGNTKIWNYGKKYYGEGIDLQTALNSSINVYFAGAGLELNARNLLETAQSFLYGETIPLDFTTLHSTFDLGNLNDRALVAQTSFGQGRVAISPLQVGMTMAAILNDGQMMQPYLIEHISDDGETVYESSREVLATPLQKQEAQKVQEYLHNTAVHYGFSEDIYGKVYAKTGTADQAHGGNSVYYLMGVEAPAGKYVIVVNYRNTGVTSSALKDVATDILGYVVTM